MDTPIMGGASATPSPSTLAERTGVYKDRVDEWEHTLSAAELWAQLNRVSIWFKLAAFAAFIASSFFVVGYFAGSLQISSWDAEQWLHGLILGVPFTATLTMFQFFLYSSGSKKAGWSSLLSFAVAAGFGVMTEIGQGMERQENRVHQRSLESPVLQSALKAIENSTTSLVTVPVSRQAVEKLAYHQYELARCNRHLKTHGQRRVDKCVDYEQKRISRYQAVVDSQTHRQQLELSAQAGTTAQLLQTAKQLERDEKHYHAFIRFLHSLFGFETYLSANFILSLLLVMAFEYAFHYLGNFERDTKAALRARGYEVKRFRHKPPKQVNEERPPVQRTLQNQYMPLQQVGFDPLLMNVNSAPVTVGENAALKSVKVQKQNKVAVKPPVKSIINKPVSGPAHKVISPSLTSSSFTNYLGKALLTGTANTSQEVQRFLRCVGISTTQKSGSESDSTSDEKVKSVAGSGQKRCTRTAPSAHLKPHSTSDKSDSPEPVKSETGQTENVQPEAEQGALSKALQSAADQLYAVWRHQILKQQIKPTFRPGKALLNQHLCRDKRRQTPTPLELDNITRQWLKRGLEEKVILPNHQQGRGHARYIVNPAQIIR